MRLPRCLNTLHVRVTALFLVLLLAMGTVYYAWMMHNVFAVPDLDPDEARWYGELAAVQMDSLAALAAAADPDRWQALAEDYGRRIAVFEGEVVFADAASGRVLAASDPDSLAGAVGALDPRMLQDMAAPDWAFDSTYPDPSNIDAYVNRIFHVAPVADRGGAPSAYLVGSYRPVILTLADTELNAHQLWLQAILVGLAGSFLVGLVVLAWLTRRIRSLSRAVAAFSTGRLDHRVDDRSGDDLGRLGRDFNVMASRLEQLIGQLRDKEDFQRQLIANISHDLRTPLASLRGYIETLGLAGQGADTEVFQGHLQVINANLDHMEKLITHLLQLSRLDANQVPVVREPFSLPELVESVLDRCRTQADEHGTCLEADYPSDLPAVSADPLLIGQVLQNLVDNGIKFGRPGGFVRIGITRTGSGELAVAVSDDGQGIAPEDQPHIFERFYVGDTSRTRKSQSSGLGLAIAAKIVAIHGSRLVVASEPGHGACFRFALAAAPPSRRAAARA